MQLALDAAPTTRPRSAPRRTRMLVAGVAAASVGVLAVNPVTATPAGPDVREMAVELSAFANPLTTWQQTLSNSLTIFNGLSTNVSASSTALSQALSNPALQTELTDFIAGNAANPLTILTALVNFPSTYGGRIGAAVQDLASAQNGSLATLPAALQASAGFLAQGRFLEAFGELNTFFLVDILADGRETLLDAFKIPGDFAASIGADPLARVLNAVISRGVVGNLGRALLGPTVTAIIQTTEILDATRAALQAGDFETALSALVNAPAKIVNAFVNGYVPDFTVDPQFPPQVFPGILSPRGTLDFLLVQLPNTVATALNARPVAPTAPLAPASAPTSPSDTGLGGDSVLLKLDAEPVVTEPVTAEPVVVTETPSDVAAQVISSETTTVPEAAAEPATTDVAPKDVEPQTSTSPADTTTKPDKTDKPEKDTSDAKPETTKPDTTKSEATKPDTTKADKPKSDATKSDATKSDAAKSGSEKSGSDGSSDSE